MNKTLEQTITRAFTGVFFWMVFVMYAVFTELEVDYLELLVLSEAVALIAPYFISYVAKSFK